MDRPTDVAPLSSGFSRDPSHESRLEVYFIKFFSAKIPDVDPPDLSLINVDTVVNVVQTCCKTAFITTVLEASASPESIELFSTGLGKLQNFLRQSPLFNDVADQDNISDPFVRTVFSKHSARETFPLLSFVQDISRALTNVDFEREALRVLETILEISYERGNLHEGLHFPRRIFFCLISYDSNLAHDLTNEHTAIMAAMKPTLLSEWCHGEYNEVSELVDRAERDADFVFIAASVLDEGGVANNARQLYEDLNKEGNGIAVAAWKRALRNRNMQVSGHRVPDILVWRERRFELTERDAEKLLCAKRGQDKRGWLRYLEAFRYR